MDWNSAFEGTASGTITNDFLRYSEVSSYKNNSPIKALSYEELCKESLTIVKRADEEPIIVDAAAAIERLKELRELNTSLYAQLKAQNDLLKEQVDIRTNTLLRIAEANEHIFSYEGDYKEFTDSAAAFRKCLQDTYTNLQNSTLNKINELEGRIRDTREKIMPLVELIKVGMDTKLTGEERDMLVAGNLCSVCYEKQVNRVYDGCGHTICGGCVEKINKKECHVCRTNFKRVLTLYLG